MTGRPNGHATTTTILPAGEKSIRWSRLLGALHAASPARTCASCQNPLDRGRNAFRSTKLCRECYERSHATLTENDLGGEC